MSYQWCEMLVAKLREGENKDKFMLASYKLDGSGEFENSGRLKVASGKALRLWDKISP